jgi:hypothetical protein
MTQVFMYIRTYAKYKEWPENTPHDLAVRGIFGFSSRTA